MDRWLNFIRGLIRPFITFSGWATILILASILTLKFADKEVALSVLGILTGTITIIIGFWFRGRIEEKKKED